MKKILFILIIYSSTLHAEAAIGNVPCYFIGSTDSLAGVGDSRAFQIDAQKRNIENEKGNIGDAISIALSPANKDGLPIINPGQVNLISRSAPGSTSADWVNRISACGTLFVPNKVFINLGGNDIIAALKEKSGLLGEFNAFLAQEKADQDAEALLQVVNFIVTRRFSANRLLTVRNVLSQGLKFFTTILNKFKAMLFKPKSSRIRFPASYSFNFHNFWNWRSDQRVDETVINMKNVSMHFLNQGATKLLLNTEAPVTLFDIRREGGADVFNPTAFETNIVIAQNFPEALKLMFNLKMKYITDVYPFLLTQKPGQVAFVDSYDVFFNNITGNYASYYLADGVHFSDQGLLEWGRQMATAMVQAGWYTPGSGYRTPGEPKFYEDLDVHKYHMYTTFKAVENNLPWSIIIDREMQFQEIGYTKDFPENGTTVYIMNGDTDVYTLSGIIRTKYKELGEGKSALGFPTSDPYVIHFDTIDRVNFECGYIDHNRLELTDPNNTSVHITATTCNNN